MIWPSLDLELPVEPFPLLRHRTKIMYTNGFPRRPFPSEYPDPDSARAGRALQKAFKALAPRGWRPYECPLVLDCTFRFVPPASWPQWEKLAALEGFVHHTSRPDASNLIKLVEDYLNQIAWADDSKIVTAISRKVYATQPGIRLVATPLSEVLSATDWTKAKQPGLSL